MKLYVGTYAKYAAGSLAGAWIDLDKLSCYEELVAACKRVHQGEDEPEFMVQDIESDGEDWQAGFTGELLGGYEDYWTVKAEFAAGAKLEPIGTVTRNEERNGIEVRFGAKPDASVLAELKAHGWRWSRFGGCWYTRHSPEAETFAAAITQGGAVASAGAKPSGSARPSWIGDLERDAKKSLAEYRAWLEADPERVRKLWKRDVAGHLRDLVAVVRLDNGSWLEVRKPAIKTEFCCGEDDHGQGGEGPGTMAYARKACRLFETEAGFKRENSIRSPYNAGRTKHATYEAGQWSRESWRLVSGTDWTDYAEKVGTGYHCQKEPERCRELSEREWREIRRMEAWRAISLRRRVNAYWKRFGASKLRTWTYWTEA